MVDLQGASMMPGLIDTHPHLFHFGAFTYPLVDLSDAVSHADIVARLRARASQTESGKWVMATPVGEAHYFLRRSWRDLEEAELPNRHVLDRASTDHPIYLQAWGPTTPNVCVFNTAALAALGIDRDSPDTRGKIWIEKDADGEPTGILRGSVNTYYTGEPEMDALLENVPLIDPDVVFDATTAAMGDYNRMGVTTVYEGHVMGELEVSVYQALHGQAALTVRVLTCLEAENYAQSWDKPLSMEEFKAGLENALATGSVDDDYLRHNGVTLSRGGPCGPGFLRMHAEYTGPYGDKTRGVTFVSGEKEDVAIEYCARTGLRLNFIGTGDRDHDEFLERAERVAREFPIKERSWILQHNFLCTPEQARRYAALGMDVTTSMSFSWGKGDLMTERIGEHVLADLIPLRRLLDAGLVVGCGTDWGPKNIFEHIALAQTHEFCGSGRRNDSPAHAVSREQAIMMWTRDAARILQWDGIGTLAPGMHADAIVVDRDPMESCVADLPGTNVLATLLGGRAVFDSGVL
jgi:predicted amidohydrolase YtcJ